MSNIQINVNCLYCVGRTHCNNPKVKRSVWGFGPRMCSEAGRIAQDCEYASRYPKPDAPPSPAAIRIRT